MKHPQPLEHQAPDPHTPAPKPPQAAAKPAKPDIKITDVHRLAATRAAVNRNVLVLDLGPREPKGPPDHATPEEIETHKSALREHSEWHAKNKEPLAVEMHQVDANHAVAADPDRYVLVPPGVRAPVTLEERVADIERRLGVETPEETAAIAKREADIAAKREAERKASA